MTLCNRTSSPRDLGNATLTTKTEVFKLATQILVLLKVQGLLIACVPLCAVVVFAVQRYYLRTSRQLRVMELESQAALFSSFLETVSFVVHLSGLPNADHYFEVSGLVSIRAFGWQSLFQARNSQSLDESLRPLYLLFCLQRWLRLVLDLIMSTIAVSIIGLAARRSGAMSSADAGVALNLILVANSTLISLVHSWAGLEMSLGAVARIRETDLHAPREDMPGEDMVPDAAWPRKGDISLNNVTAYHGYDEETSITFLLTADSPSIARTTPLCEA